MTFEYTTVRVSLIVEFLHDEKKKIVSKIFFLGNSDSSYLKILIGFSDQVFLIQINISKDLN